LVFNVKWLSAYLIIFSISFGQFDKYNLANYPIQRSEIEMPVPARAMFKSFILPGWGQVQNEDPLWKPLLFAGVEVLGIFSSFHYEKRAENIRLDFEAYGDNHWALERWYTNTQKIFPDRWKEIIVGTHKLGLKIAGNYYHTDRLAELVNNHGWSEIAVIRDRDFYENIGKYDQFVGGWDDEYDDPFDTNGNWFTEEKGNVESIMLTKRKDYYRSLRHDSNLLKHYSKYAVTVVMINHITSGFEAAWTANKKAKKIPEIKLYYNPLNKWGVGGVQINYGW